MAFTDAEMAVLAQLAYCGSKDTPAQPLKGQNLYKALTTGGRKEYLTKALGKEYKSVIEGLISKAKDQDYSIVLTADDKKGTGFAAIAIKDPNNNVTVATRGTEGFSLDYDSRKDVDADLQLALMLSTNQQEEMEKFMRNLEKNNYDGYYFTGHSLGGNLANYGAITLKPIEKVKGVVTFNAPGFNEAFHAKYMEEIATIYHRINNYQNEYDYVSSILYVPGPVTIVESSKKEDGWFDFDDHIGFGDHSLCNLKVDGDGFDAKEKQVKSGQTTVVHGLIEGLRGITGIKAYTVVVGVLSIGVNLGRAAVSAFKKASNWIKGVFSGKSSSLYGTFLQMNTSSLRTYADRLYKVNDRIIKLDQRLDKLYGKVKLKDLWDLMQADLLTGESWRVNKCINYLNDTASDFETLERNLANQL